MKKILVCVLVLFLSQSVSAQSLDPLNVVVDRASLGMSFLQNKVEVELEDDGDTLTNDIDRSILAFTVKFPVAEKFSGSASLGYSFKSELELLEDIPGDAEGDGLLLQVGLNTSLYSNDMTEIVGFVKGSYVKEKYGKLIIDFNEFDVDGDLFELSAGGHVNVRLKEHVRLSAGVELIPLSEGEVEGDGSNDTLDMSRDGFFVLHVGAGFNPTEELSLGVDLALVGETTFQVFGNLSF